MARGTDPGPTGLRIPASGLGARREERREEPQSAGDPTRAFPHPSKGFYIFTSKKDKLRVGLLGVLLGPPRGPRGEMNRYFSEGRSSAFARRKQSRQPAHTMNGPQNRRGVKRQLRQKRQ